MLFFNRTVAARLLLSAILSLFGGCTETPSKASDSVPTAGHDSQSAQEVAGKFQPEMGRSAPFSKPLRRLDGAVDLENRYAYTLRVKAAASSPARECSGALIAPRVVLTAAHCVCMQQRLAEPGHRAKILLDSSQCVATAIVTAVSYLPSQDDGATRTLNEVHTGVVRPHPRFKVLLDSQRSMELSQANIALILLDTPVSTQFHPVELASTEVTKDEVLVMAGYGDNGNDKDGGDDRRFSKHRVMEPPNRVMEPPKGESDLFALTPPVRPNYQDDSGGPCLHEVRGTQHLVGISLRGLGMESICTSTHLHAAWIQEELRRANHAGSPSNP